MAEPHGLPPPRTPRLANCPATEFETSRSLVHRPLRVMDGAPWGQVEAPGRANNEFKGGSGIDVD